MEHVSFLLKIAPADYGEYVARHRQVDPELEAQFAQVGIRGYHIFFHEGTLFAYMQAENFAEAMQRLSEHPANVRWQAFMADLLQLWENGLTVKTIPGVYHFTS